VDEELSKIKEKLAARHAEREKRRENNQTSHKDDDFFDTAPAQVDRRRAQSDDEMDVDVQPTRTNRKRAVQNLSDNEEMEAPAPKKRQRAAPAKATRAPPTRNRQASDSSEAPSVRRTPARKVAGRARKVGPITDFKLIDSLSRRVMMTTKQMEMTKTVSLNCLKKKTIFSRHHLELGISMRDKSDVRRKQPAKKAAASKSMRQSTLNFTSSQASRRK